MKDLWSHEKVDFDAEPGDLVYVSLFGQHQFIFMNFTESGLCKLFWVKRNYFIVEDERYVKKWRF